MSIEITNAKDRPLSANPGTLPDVSGALLSWFQPMTFQKIAKTLVNFSIVETPTSYDTQGVRQPFSPQQLAMKPRGQRQWHWETFHTIPGTVLVPDDVALFNGFRYRVMAKLDYSEYGYIEYHLVRDYLPANDLTTDDGSSLSTQGDGRIVK